GSLISGKLESMEAIIGLEQLGSYPYIEGSSILTLKNPVRISEGVYEWGLPFKIVGGDNYFEVTFPLTLHMKGPVNFYEEVEIKRNLNTKEYINMENNKAMYHKDVNGNLRRTVVRGTDNDLHINPDKIGALRTYGNFYSEGA